MLLMLLTAWHAQGVRTKSEEGEERDLTFFSVFWQAHDRGNALHFDALNIAQLLASGMALPLCSTVFAADKRPCCVVLVRLIGGGASSHPLFSLSPRGRRVAAGVFQPFRARRTERDDCAVL